MRRWRGGPEGATWRNIDKYLQVLALAGCDLLTISPKLLAELDNMSQDAPKKFVFKALRRADCNL